MLQYKEMDTIQTIATTIDSKVTIATIQRRDKECSTGVVKVDMEKNGQIWKHRSDEINRGW